MFDHTTFSGKTVLLTGGAGFVGSHILEALLQSDAVVVVVDNFITGQRQNWDKVLALTGKTATLIEADVSQPAENYLPAEFHPDYILHFASPASPPRYQAHPLETYQANTWATHYLLDWQRRFAPQASFLFASTSEVYGDPLVHPQTEAYWGNVNPNGPRSCYDEAKRLGETICGIFHQLYQLDTRIVRIFNTYGPRMDFEDGRVIPNLLWAALHNQPLTIYGDGQQTRSYCYVTDLVRGILQIVGTAQLSGQTFNLGNPDEYTILETAKIIQRLFSGDSAAPFEFLPLPKDDPTRRQPDISKITQTLGWKPQIGFEEGLRQTAVSFQEK